MTPEERKTLDELCKRIAEEKDPLVFDQLVREMSALLEAKHARIHPEHKRMSN